MSSQLTFPFKSLDFPGRTVLAPNEISRRLGISLPQIYALIDEGSFTILDVSKDEAKRRSVRIPIESYRDFVIARISGPGRYDLLRQLPRETLTEVHNELTRLLAA